VNKYIIDVTIDGRSRSSVVKSDSERSAVLKVAKKINPLIDTVKAFGSNVFSPFSGKVANSFPYGDRVKAVFTTKKYMTLKEFFGNNLKGVFVISLVTI